MKVEFDSRNIEDMLDKFKSDGRRDPFIINRVLDLSLTVVLTSS